MVDRRRHEESENGHLGHSSTDVKTSLRVSFAGKVAGQDLGQSIECGRGV